MTSELQVNRYVPGSAVTVRVAGKGVVPKFPLLW
jgi:hypothetical protein